MCKGRLHVLVLVFLWTRLQPYRCFFDAVAESSTTAVACHSGTSTIAEAAAHATSNVPTHIHPTPCTNFANAYPANTLPTWPMAFTMPPAVPLMPRGTNSRAARPSRTCTGKENRPTAPHHTATAAVVGANPRREASAALPGTVAPDQNMARLAASAALQRTMTGALRPPNTVSDTVPDDKPPTKPPISMATIPIDAASTCMSFQSTTTRVQHM